MRIQPLHRRKFLHETHRLPQRLRVMCSCVVEQPLLRFRFHPLLGVLGEMDAAFDVLARAEEEYQGLVSYTGLPGYDSLRSDARFAALLQRLELSP